MRKNISGLAAICGLLLAGVNSIVVSDYLFDMDGTLIDSTAGLEGAWRVFAHTYPGIDVTEILSSAHGIRTIDNLRTFCGLEDPDELERESLRFEEAIVSSATEAGKQGIVALPGARAAMVQLLSSVHPASQPIWAICTSGTRAYATKALSAGRIPVPEVFVTADDVSNGKPHPEPFLTGASKCGVKPDKCVVFEDSPNGIRSGKAAGCKTVALLTTHSRDQMLATGPDFLIEDLTSVSIKCLEKGLTISLSTV